MVKKQQLAVGGLTSLFSSSNKQQDISTPDAVLPSHSSSSSMSSSSYSTWQWTSCGFHPRTLSFRQQQEEDANGHACQHCDNDSHMAMMKQQAYYNSDSCFSTNTLASVDSFSTASDAEAEAVIRGVRSDRLLFKPEDASSFKRASKANKLIIEAMDDDVDKDTTMSKAATAAFGGAMAMSLESQNPYRDFRESMEAMVVSQSQGGVKDWRWLEEMLGWYLKANGESTHGLILGAFVDLLVALSTATSPADSSSPATPAAANCLPSSDCSCSSSSSYSSSCSL
ncbi:hypothetical protein BAE44_0011114 [Dichanthelium oligosanthes]|uniref:Transcription repressor n=1 Tax=Dichanthelium oligosanthes TaxID=888268 RepID=A0A1E5VRX4_9POAL|nr:hypothetical protein BAE44_0011114 [Dichanthelium oligosanthes]